MSISGRQELLGAKQPITDLYVILYDQSSAVLELVGQSSLRAYTNDVDGKVNIALLDSVHFTGSFYKPSVNARVFTDGDRLLLIGDDLVELADAMYAIGKNTNSCKKLHLLLSDDLAAQVQYNDLQPGPQPAPFPFAKKAVSVQDADFGVSTATQREDIFERFEEKAAVKITKDTIIFVFGVSAHEDYPEMPLVCTTPAQYWDNNGYMLDDYSDEEMEALQAAFASAGLNVVESMESVFEVIGDYTLDDVRDILTDSPYFIYDEDFEAFSAVNGS